MSDKSLSSTEPIDREIRSLELRIKEAELQIRRQEIEKSIQSNKHLNWSAIVPIITVIVGGLLTFWSSERSAYNQRNNELILERQKSQTSLVLEAIKTGDRDKAAQNLKWFVQVGFLDDPHGTIAKLVKEDNLPVLPSQNAELLKAGQNQINSVLSLQRGDTEQAKQDLQKSENLTQVELKNNPSNIIAKLQQGFNYKTQAQISLEKGDIDNVETLTGKAMTMFREVAGSAVGNAEQMHILGNAFTGMGNVLHIHKDYRGSIKYYELAINAFPGQQYAWRDMLIAYIDLDGRNENDAKAMCRAFHKLKEIGLSGEFEAREVPELRDCTV